MKRVRLFLIAIITAIAGIGSFHVICEAAPKARITFTKDAPDYSYAIMVQDSGHARFVRLAEVRTGRGPDKPRTAKIKKRAKKPAKKSSSSISYAIEVSGTTDSRLNDSRTTVVKSISSGLKNAEKYRGSRRFSPETIRRVKEKYGRAISEVARKRGVDEKTLVAMIVVESGGNPNAEYKGCSGLLQLAEGTARNLGVNPLDPYQCIDGGARYLKYQLERFGDLPTALAAYNQGPNKVASKLKRGELNPERLDYVKKVAHIYKMQDDTG